MNELQKFDFNGLSVSVIDKSGEVWFKAQDVCQVVGVQNVTQAVDRLDDDERSMFNIGRQGEVNFISEPGLYHLLNGSRKPEARPFQRWVNHEVLPAIRKTGSYKAPSKDQLEKELIGAKYTSEILRLDDTSKIRMIETVYTHHHLPTDALPSYVDAEVTQSLSKLLKDNGVPFGAAKANNKLIKLGLLEIKERPSSKGGTKEFKSLTDKGSYFGKNLLNPKSPKETQPHYYPSKFAELLKLLGDDS